MSIQPEVPRRLPPSVEEQVRVVSERASGVSDRGRTRWSRQVQPFGTTASTASGGIVVVIHGDDPSVSRPSAPVVYWVGAATPANGADYDFWYTADVL